VSQDGSDPAAIVRCFTLACADAFQICDACHGWSKRYLAG